MMLDAEKMGYLVRTPDGPGIIVIIEQDAISHTCYAIVRLDEDKTLQRYAEEELEAITAEPKQKKDEDKTLIKDSDVIKYYKIKNTIIHLNSIRTVSMSERDNRIYISYKTGDTRTEVICFSTLEEAQKEFTNIENILGVFTYV